MYTAQGTRRGPPRPHPRAVAVPALCLQLPWGLWLPRGQSGSNPEQRAPLGLEKGVLRVWAQRALAWSGGPGLEPAVGGTRGGQRGKGWTRSPPPRFPFCTSHPCPATSSHSTPQTRRLSRSCKAGFIPHSWHRPGASPRPLWRGSDGPLTDPRCPSGTLAGLGVVLLLWNFLLFDQFRKF